MITVTGAFHDGATYTVQITGRADHPVIGSYRAAASSSTGARALPCPPPAR